jgi:hypothetical protein
MNIKEKDGRVWSAILCQKIRSMAESCGNGNEEVLAS